MTVGIVISYFFIPFPNLTVEQGTNSQLVFSHSIVWIAGILIFIQRAIRRIYNINQPPLIQELNLPEAQGQIRSWNQFLESLGNGLGPLLAGIILTATYNNFQFAAVLAIFIALPGIIAWILALKFYKNDILEIHQILNERIKVHLPDPPLP
ncbi:MAG: hypothetical protein ACTSYI_18150 [Promethearchaeota archaeon]